MHMQLSNSLSGILEICVFIVYNFDFQKITENKYWTHLLIYMMKYLGVKFTDVCNLLSI